MESVLSVMSEIDRINIRSKPTKVPEISKQESKIIIPPSPELVNEDLRAAVVVQMDSIDSVPSNKFKVKTPPPRSPAPLPEAISPAGVPIDVMTSPEMKDIRSVTGSPKSVRGEFKIDLSGLDEVDMTVEGLKPEEYKRNVRGSVVVIGILLLSLHLFLNHLTMFNWVYNFDSPDQVVAAVLYFMSTIMVLAMLLATLAVPALSMKEDKFRMYYSPILVAGVIDMVAVLMGGGMFSPVSFYSQDSREYGAYTEIGLVLTVMIYGALYYVFTRTSEDGNIFYAVHPFEKLRDDDEEPEPEQEQKEVGDEPKDELNENNSETIAV